MKEFILKPIGVLHSEKKYRYETPRQGVLADDALSVIELEPHLNFEQALKDLEGFDRIWVIYLFHLNPNWKPLVQPPRHSRKKIGVFATRSPHRPNPIGISCVRLKKVEGLRVFITNSDILDGSPVLDIKPYLPYSDSFPESKTGWVKAGLEEMYAVSYSELARKQMLWLKENSGTNLFGFSKLQLEFKPSDNSRKRIRQISLSEITGSYELAYRTWRIYYEVNEKDKRVFIMSIGSGYTDEELSTMQADTYGDKDIHRKFNSVDFNKTDNK
ncbi:MAG TPA: tRNA (N6-threonylcarbamoyladenosine(37)-N6)-methyltransferase TrmO [Ignavibacteriales bacterium]|nr:tRNA (N6-threonylcarbamoyladenosine(37)-N6)-methyltransferase TrmO [Ignavibacteriales bacterium]